MSAAYIVACNMVYDLFLKENYQRSGNNTLTSAIWYDWIQINLGKVQCIYCLDIVWNALT